MNHKVRFGSIGSNSVAIVLSGSHLLFLRGIGAAPQVAVGNFPFRELGADQIFQLQFISNHRPKLWH